MLEVGDIVEQIELTHENEDQVGLEFGKRGPSGAGVWKTRTKWGWSLENEDQVGAEFGKRGPSTLAGVSHSGIVFCCLDPAVPVLRAPVWFLICVAEMRSVPVSCSVASTVIGDSSSPVPMRDDSVFCSCCSPDVTDIPGFLLCCSRSLQNRGGGPVCLVVVLRVPWSLNCGPQSFVVLGKFLTSSVMDRGDRRAPNEPEANCDSAPASPGGASRGSTPPLRLGSFVTPIFSLGCGGGSGFFRPGPHRSTLPRSAFSALGARAKERRRAMEQAAHASSLLAGIAEGNALGSSSSLNLRDIQQAPLSLVLPRRLSSPSQMMSIGASDPARERSPPPSTKGRLKEEANDDSKMASDEEEAMDTSTTPVQRN
ncbi:unnamed protein product, partial [Cyprideis torosa]